MASSSGCLVGLLFETLALLSADPARLISRIVLFVALLYSGIVPRRIKLHHHDIIAFVLSRSARKNIRGKQTLSTPLFALQFRFLKYI